jgi:hypothetical protein
VLAESGPGVWWASELPCRRGVESHFGVGTLAGLLLEGVPGVQLLTPGLDTGTGALGVTGQVMGWIRWGGAPPSLQGSSFFFNGIGHALRCKRMIAMEFFADNRKQRGYGRFVSGVKRPRA